MNELETRAFELAGIEIRDDDDGYHHLVGIVAPWAATYDTGRYIESFGPKVFDKSIKERGDRIPLLEQHNRSANPVGMSVSWEKTADGLVGDFRLARTNRGEEVRQLATDGMVTGLSVGFHPVRNQQRTVNGRQHVSRIEARLDHVGFVTAPAYDNAQVLAVRGFDPDDDELAPRLARWRHLLNTD